MKQTPKKPTTTEDVTHALEAVGVAKVHLSNAKAKLKEDRKAVRALRIKLKQKKRFCKRTFWSALKNKPL